MSAEGNGARVEAPKVDASAIVGRGHYEILGDFALRDELDGQLHETLYAGIEQFAGVACRRAVEQDGLRFMHRHFPVEKLDLLVAFLLKRMRERLYYWSYAVGARNLGLAHPFYVDYLIVIRIHYPYLVARDGGKPVKPPFPIGEKLRLAGAVARNPRLLSNHVAKMIRKREMRQRFQIRYDAAKYHGGLPARAHAHGAHVDTWYGHSYDGINLWLSIDGVNEDNTVILYPEMFGRKVDYDPTSMYLAAGIPLPKPTKVALEPGELLLFNPEMLHGTQVNISDETRLALTTRINPGVPRFNDDAPFNFEHWYSSEDLERRQFNRIKLFPADRFQDTPSIRQRSEVIGTRTVKRTIEAVAPDDGELVLCPVEALREGEKLVVDGPDLKLFLVRTPAGIKAYDRRCPHRGIDLADGHHDADRIYCPGHGVAFALADGTSNCRAFALRALDVTERDGQIVLRRRKGAPATGVEARGAAL